MTHLLTEYSKHGQTHTGSESRLVPPEATLMAGRFEKIVKQNIYVHLNQADICQQFAHLITVSINMGIVLTDNAYDFILFMTCSTMKE